MDKTRKACIVVPVYKAITDQYELIALQQCFVALGNYQVFFAVPQHLEGYISATTWCLTGQASYKTFDDQFFADIPGYNRLLKSPVFYQAFLAYEYLLIYQLDAFAFKDELLHWCNQGYANIGAPVFEGHDFSTASSPIVGQGNGGFCLRNVAACYKVVTSLRKLNYKKEYTDSNSSVLRKVYRYVKHDLLHNYSLYPFQPILNEDLFWSVLVPAAFPEFKVPDPRVSVGFSFEMHPDILFEMNGKTLPFGCHAWLKYDFAFWKPYIEEMGYKL